MPKFINYIFGVRIRTVKEIIAFCIQFWKCIRNSNSINAPPSMLWRTISFWGRISGTPLIVEHWRVRVFVFRFPSHSEQRLSISTSAPGPPKTSSLHENEREGNPSERDIFRRPKIVRVAIVEPLSSFRFVVLCSSMSLGVLEHATAQRNDDRISTRVTRTILGWRKISCSLRLPSIEDVTGRPRRTR